jgi:Mn2+/Fe2+ NRAMP family transporter
MEATLSTGYEFAQGLGWNWGERLKPHEASRFSFTYTVVLLVSCLPIALGVDPLGLTVFSMALNALILPTLVIPFLVLMNQREYLGDHVNGRLGNIVVGGIVMITFVLALVSIPLEIFGG